MIPPPAMVQLDDDRRDSSRARTVYWVCRVEAAGGQGLGRARNISDGGMKLSLDLPVMLGDVIHVALADQTELAGRVVWTKPGECGLQFDNPIESMTMLREAAQHLSSGEGRPPRLQTTIPAVAMSEDGMKAVRIRDVSQRGMKLATTDEFQPGLKVKVMLGSGVERRGVVRWASDGFAGLMLTEPFAVGELGDMSTL